MHGKKTFERDERESGKKDLERKRTLSQMFDLLKFHITKLFFFLRAKKKLIMIYGPPAGESARQQAYYLLNLISAVLSMQMNFAFL